jgi:hypothetical protein
MFKMMRILLVFVWCAVCGFVSLEARRASFVPERVLGSSELKMAELQWLLLPADADASVRSAAEELRALIELRYAVRIEVRETPLGPCPKNAIVLRRKRLPWDELSIHRERTRVIVGASTDENLVNGIYTLCRDVLGARWYWSGELGFEWAGDRIDPFPNRRWHESPVFIQQGSPGKSDAFRMKNRTVRDYTFMHALSNVFTAEVYETDREVFAVRKGARKQPKGHRGTDWQPDFTNPRAAEIAAEAALAHFKAHPESASFSLSVNDNMGFDESARTEAAVSPLEYFRGRPNYTDLVFRFMNEVAEQVFDQAGAWETEDGRPRYLTALAYFWTEQSPSFQLHPRVMPVLTSDRSQWHDPEYRAEDKALIQRWSESGAERLATWDYYYGPQYPYPCQFNQWMAESLAYMSEQGVRAFFSQQPTGWGLDGAKAWLMAQLLWDPTQDAEALLDEFYTNMFGAAAGPIRQFYETAERHRNAHAGEAMWIKFFTDEAGIELFTEAVLQEMRAYIQEAEVLITGDARRSERVAVVSDAFQLTELYARTHRARVDLVELSLDVLNDRSADGNLADAFSGFVEAKSQFKAYAADLIQQPMHSKLKAFTRQGQSNPTSLAMAALAYQGDRLPDQSAASSSSRVAQRWANQPEAVTPVLTNPTLTNDGAPWTRQNFLGPDLPAIPGWEFRYRPYEHFKVESVSGHSGVKLSGADLALMSIDVPVTGGAAYVLDFSSRYLVSPDNRTQVQLSWKDATGRSLKFELPLNFPIGQSDGVTRVVIPTSAPAGATELRITFWCYRQSQDDFLELHRVDFGKLPGKN